MKTVAIIQARMSSSRLPGKVMADIAGMPMLSHVTRRVQQAKLIDLVVVATSIHASDKEIVNFCRKEDIPCYSGSLDDVLDRYYRATKHFKADSIVRITADCPLLDSAVIDKVVQFFLDGDFDYVSNTLAYTYPDGLDTEVFKYKCLEQAWKEAVLPSQREHVTPFIYQQPDRFRIGSFKNNRDLSMLRWTVDEPEDFELISIIYNNLYSKNPKFTTNDILAFLDTHPDLKTMNTHHERNEGMKKSLDKDAMFLKSTGGL